mmetsp:Transcript_7260/g.15701  ORF Transcript_7260/g.15701 Transcript_7260/m.15701 type:complete len:476 (-) Transcript_7260:4-1431(-)
MSSCTAMSMIRLRALCMQPAWQRLPVRTHSPRAVQCRFAHKKMLDTIFTVVELTPDEKSQRQHTLLELIRRPCAARAPDLEKTAVARVDTRDIMSLGITRAGEVEAEARRVCILPRRGCFLLALGHVKAIVYHDLVYFLGADRQDVGEEVDRIWRTMHNSSAEDSDLGEQDPMRHYFELHTLDASLEVAGVDIRKHLQLLSELSDSFVRQVEAAAPNDVIERLVHCQPLLDELGALESRVRKMDLCLEQIMVNDEDMAAMLLSARRTGRHVDKDSEDHDELEVILETHRRTYRDVLDQAERLTKNVKFGWALGDLKLSAYRAQLDRINVHVGVGAVALSTAAVVTGGFGMNVPVPFAESPHAFEVIVGGCAAFVVSFWAIITRGILSDRGARLELHRTEKALASRKIMGDIAKVAEILRLGDAQDAANAVSLQSKLEAGLGRVLSLAELERVKEILPIMGAELQSPAPPHDSVAR